MGRATAEVFLERGWTVLALDLAPLEIDAGGGRLVPIVADVRDREVLDTALREHVPDLGGTSMRSRTSPGSTRPRRSRPRPPSCSTGCSM